MVEWGSYTEPPNFQNLTVWGIVTLVIMAILGLDSIYGASWAIKFDDTLYSILILVGSGFGIAGLVLVILSLVLKISHYMTVGIFCFLISCIVSTIYLVFCILRGDFENQSASAILHLILDICLCILFFLQNKGFTPSSPA